MTHLSKERTNAPRSAPRKEIPKRPPSRVSDGWGRRLALVLMLCLLSLLLASVALGYYATDHHLTVGYRPVQPIQFSHRLHAGELGLDCRFCHAKAERGRDAGLPSLKLCMGCHGQILPESVKLLPLRASYAEQRPLRWVRVGALPEFSYFDHGAHSLARVGCSTCHGRVDLMERTEQAVAHTMGFCLDCHRAPEPFLRSSAEITDMTWTPDRRQRTTASVEPAGTRPLTPPLHCSGCHR